MAKRNYKLQDVSEYLLEYYGLDWKMFLIDDFGMERRITQKDFNVKDRSCLMAAAIMYHGSKRMPVWLNVSNHDLVVGVLQPIKPAIQWSDYLALKHHEEKTL
ncbi:MAG: hypothetical protein ACLRFE_04525 [Clostridia bacterium]